MVTPNSSLRQLRHTRCYPATVTMIASVALQSELNTGA